ncbi:MAG: CHAD domain-containing protein [Candidatus Sphingomonas colombiensis]|nr:CHAD domain-containing protein [Sphingomonas sp.]WEK43229.1 MAG: CHAD domain-containing protein [Sphingomonas sp.]
MPAEIELKLEVTREAADAFEGSGLLPGKPVKAQQRSIYFDMPDHSLSKNGLSLRIRRSGGKRIQTVKAKARGGGGGAGLFVRSEWECAVTSDTPILDDTTPIRALVGDSADHIAPLFQVRIERRTWLVTEDGASIELVIDRGVVEAGDRTAAICEIELELKNGEPAALFALARRIDAVAPVRLGVISKAERGYRLLAALSEAAGAEPVSLSGGMSIADAFRQIIQACMRQFRLNEEVLLQKRRPEALHQARVALRRARSAFSIFKRIVSGEKGDGVREELGWLASQLGDARNLDVLLERAESGTLHDGIAAASTAAYDRVEGVLASARARALMLDLAEWAATGDWLNARGAETDRRQLARTFAITALDRLRRKVKRGGRHLAGADDRARHELRKNAKKLRYASMFFVTLFEDEHKKRRYKRFVALLDKLQDELGTLNDLAMTPKVLEKFDLGAVADAQSLFEGGAKKVALEAAVDAYAALIDSRRFWR